MKKALFILFIAIVGTCVSCEKDDSGTAEIYGRWKLTETMSDPGDGSGKYLPVTGPAKYINIDASGKIEGEAIPQALSYKILDSVQLEITLKTYAQPLIYQYKVTSNTLLLNPPCIEGCGLRFVRK